MNNAEIDWSLGTWEGSRREQIRTTLTMTLDEKLDWLDSAQDYVDDVISRRAAQGLPSYHASGEKAIVPEKIPKE